MGENAKIISERRKEIPEGEIDLCAVIPAFS
jgi:hypothetical protein